MRKRAEILSIRKVVDTCLVDTFGNDIESLKNQLAFLPLQDILSMYLWMRLIGTIRSLQTLAGRIVAVSQSFRRYQLSARTHHHQPQRRPRPSRPRAEILCQTHRPSARHHLALRPRNRRPHRQRHARTKRERTGMSAGVFAPNHWFIKKQPAL